MDFEECCYAKSTSLPSFQLLVPLVKFRPGDLFKNPFAQVSHSRDNFQIKCQTGRCTTQKGRSSTLPLKCWPFELNLKHKNQSPSKRYYPLQDRPGSVDFHRSLLISSFGCCTSYRNILPIWYTSFQKKKAVSFRQLSCHYPC